MTVQKKLGFLSQLEKSIGLADPELKWYESMLDRAIDLGVHNYTANLLFDKKTLSEIQKIDYLYLLIRIYGFFTVLKIIRKGLGFLLEKIKFSYKMNKIGKRSLPKM
jgi:hypothetical protein